MGQGVGGLHRSEDVGEQGDPWTWLSKVARVDVTFRRDPWPMP